MFCPKCGSSKVVTDRDMDPPHTCTECWRAFEDKDIVVANKDQSAETEVQLGEVLGWRAWYIIDTPDGVRLRSLMDDHIWAPGAVEQAICELMRGHISAGSVEAATYGEAGVPWDIAVPVERCSCGFYAALSREHLQRMSYHRYDQDDGAPKCVGQVAMSGKVIPGTQGWKSQEMWPHKLFVPYEYWKYVEPLKREYKCEVELSVTLAK